MSEDSLDVCDHNTQERCPVEKGEGSADNHLISAEQMSVATGLAVEQELWFEGAPVNNLSSTKKQSKKTQIKKKAQ